MSRTDDLIARYCPNGVEMDTIGNLCKINRGRVMSKDYLAANQGDYPVYSSQTANEGMLGKIKTYDYDGEYLTWTTDGAYAGSVFYRKGKFSITNICGLLDLQSDKLLIKFLYYYLGNVTKNYVNAGMGNPKLMSNVMERIKVAVPPLAVQEEIVNILDSFTLLEAELEAELEARKKQYEHYRDELLNIAPEAYRPIIDIADTFIGLVTTMTTHYVEDGVKLLNNCNIKENHIKITKQIFLDREFAKSNASRQHKLGDIITVHTGDVGTSAVITKEFDGSLGFATIVTRIKNQNVVLPQFIAYYLNSSINKRAIQSMIKSDRNNLNIKDFNKLKVPVPPLAEQERIVGILDKFDALVNDISDGLPAEINARRQQYEYYRDKLLNFEPMAA